MLCSYIKETQIMNNSCFNSDILNSFAFPVHFGGGFRRLVMPLSRIFEKLFLEYHPDNLKENLRSFLTSAITTTARHKRDQGNQHPHLKLERAICKTCPFKLIYYHRNASQNASLLSNKEHSQLPSPPSRLLKCFPG